MSLAQSYDPYKSLPQTNKFLSAYWHHSEHRAVKAAAFGAEATEAVDFAAEALVVAVAFEDGDAVTKSRSTTLPPQGSKAHRES